MIMHFQCFHKSDCYPNNSHRRSSSPESKKEFDRITKFTLGHVTSSTFLQSILAVGLIPDTDKERAADDRVPSDNESVYLAATYDPLYPRRAVQNHGGKPIVIEVEVSRDSLIADEAMLCADDLQSLTPDQALYRSLSAGACKHHGPIPISSILTISWLDGTIIYEGAPT